MENNQSQFPLSLASPKIELPALLQFETARNHSLSNKIISRLNDLQTEYNEVKELYNWNAFVEEFDINFQVRLNQTYYLYSKGERKFLSLIEPTEIGNIYNYHGQTKLSSEGYFIKVI